MPNRKINPVIIVNMQMILWMLNEIHLVHLKCIWLFRRNKLVNSLNLCMVAKCSKVPFLMFVLSKQKMKRSYLESLIRSGLFTSPQMYKYLTCKSELYKDY